MIKVGSRKASHYFFPTNLPVLPMNASIFSLNGRFLGLNGFLAVI
jgi:hypothetical protein